MGGYSNESISQGNYKLNKLVSGQNDNYITVKDRDKGYVKIKGKSTIFDFENGKKVEFRYSSVKTSAGGLADARLKDGGKYRVGFGDISVSDSSGRETKTNNLYFDEDGDGIADTYYKVSDLQEDKVKGHSVKIDSEYIDKKLEKIANTDSSNKRERRLERLRKKMQKAGVSEEIINQKLYPSQSQNVFASNPYFGSEQTGAKLKKQFTPSQSSMGTFDKEKADEQKMTEVKMLVKEFNKSIKKGEIAESKKLSDKMSEFMLTDEQANELNVPKSARYQNALNDLKRVTDNTDFDKIRKYGLEHFKGTRIYDQLKEQIDYLESGVLQRMG